MMFRLSQFAAPIVLGAAMVIGAGCAGEEHPQNIPLNAREIGEAKETVSYTAPDNGTIYVEDATAHKMIYSGQVKKGQMVKVDAKENQVMVDNQLATKTDLLNDHKYALYFEKSSDLTGEAQTSGQHINIQTEPQSNSPQGATITTPGGTKVTTPNDATVTQPPPQQNNTTITVPPPEENNSNNNSGGTSVTVPPPSNNGGTTVTTPNGTVVKEHQQQ